MRDSEILQAKMAARLLSGLKDERDVRPSMMYPEPVGNNESLAPKPQGT